MLQVVRRLHNGTTALAGIMCSMLCDEIASIASLFNASLVSAGGCYGTSERVEENTYATFLRVIPGSEELGNIYSKVVKQFRQVIVRRISAAVNCPMSLVFAARYMLHVCVCHTHCVTTYCVTTDKRRITD